MIAFDTNILVHAHRRDSPFHGAAVEVVRNAATGRDPWAIPWPSAHEFLAVTTHPRIFSPPSPTDAAIDQLRAWFESPSVNLLSEDDGYFDRLSESLVKGAVTGPKVHDARIAALCLHFGATVLYTADRDFSRFPTLKTANPLVTR